MAQFEHFQLFGENPHQAAQFFDHRINAQQFLLFFQTDPDIRRQRVHQLQRVIDVQRGAGEFAGDARHEFGHTPELLDHVTHQRFDFERIFERFRRQGHVRDKVRLGISIGLDFHPRHALHQQADRAVRRAEEPVNLGDRTVSVDFVRAGRFEFRIA